MGTVHSTAPAEDAPEGIDRRLVLMLFFGILCLGMAAGLELFGYLGHAGQPAAMLAAAPSRFVEEDETLPRQPHPLTFGELCQILSARRPEPGAQRFYSEFMARPGLRAIYDRFASGPDSQPAADFVAALQASPDFGDVLRASSRDPDFRTSAEQVVRHPEIARLLRVLRSPGDRAAPRAAPAGVVADTIRAETDGATSPAGPVQAPGQPLQ